MSRGGSRPALHLRFDVPGERGFAVFVQDGVGTDGVEVFAVDEEAVHVEETGPDGREPSRHWVSTVEGCGLGEACLRV